MFWCAECVGTQAMEIGRLLANFKGVKVSKFNKKLIAAVIVFSVGILAPYPLTGLIGAFVALGIMEL